MSPQEVINSQLEVINGAVKTAFNHDDCKEKIEYEVQQDAIRGDKEAAGELNEEEEGGDEPLSQDHIDQCNGCASCEE